MERVRNPINGRADVSTRSLRSLAQRLGSSPRSLSERSESKRGQRVETPSAAPGMSQRWRFSRTRMFVMIGVPSKPKISRRRRWMNRR